MKALRHVLALIFLGITISPAWAADEAVIQDLQTDVTVTKSKADKNAQDINSLMGGLPAVEARVAALEAALNSANGTIGQLQADLAAAIAQIGQLQTDLNAEVSARQAADVALDTAHMSADANLQAQIDVLSAVDVGALDNRVSDVEETLTCVTYDVVAKDLIFVGCNVHVRDGTGLTQSSSGLGNLIVGYNTDTTGLLSRFGSHNVILGDEQSYTEFGQLLTQFVGTNQDMSVVVAGSLSESISNNRTTTVGSDSSLIVGLNLETSVAKDAVVTVGRNLAESIGGNVSSRINQDVNVLIDGNLTEVVAEDLSVQAGMIMNLHGGDELSLTSGDASTRMTKNGDIVTSGRGITIHASGPLVLKGSQITQN